MYDETLFACKERFEVMYYVIYNFAQYYIPFYILLYWYSYLMSSSLYIKDWFNIGLDKKSKPKIIIVYRKYCYRNHFRGRLSFVNRDKSFILTLLFNRSIFNSLLKRCNYSIIDWKQCEEWTPIQEENKNEFSTKQRRV